MSIEIGSVQWIAQMDMSRPLVRPPIMDDPQARAYWRGVHLVPTLPVLITQLTSSFADELDRCKNTKISLEQLPYSLGGMSYAFFEFTRRQAALKTLAPDRAYFVPSPDETEPLSYMIDMFLVHARRAADATIPYLRQRYSLHGSPWSIADWKQWHFDQVPDGDVRNLVREYWERHGKNVRDYRALAQHYTLLVYDDCGLFVSANGTPAMYVALPNNPKEKLSKLSYDPPVHALPYMREVFYETIRFVNRLSARLLDPAKPLNVASVGPHIRGRMKLSRQGIGIPSPAMIDAELRKLMAELAEGEGQGAG